MESFHRPQMSSVKRNEADSDEPSKARDSSNQNVKSFVCNNPGCNKSFTRAEHLQRHALNHSPGGLACDVCSANFKRPDLLKRHMDRHRQKDLEAGGPGCGTLDTRKRAWRAADGNVVSKRPRAKPVAQPSHQSENRDQAQQEPSPEPEDEINNALLPPNTITQPGHNLDSIGSGTYEIPSQHLEIHPDNRSPTIDRFGSSLTSDSVNPLLGYSDPGHGQNLDQTSAYDDFWVEQGQPYNFLDSALYSDQFDYDQIFQPDTASSFNMPFTTAVDYNWLFHAKPKISEPNLTRQTALCLPDEPAVGFIPPGPGLSPESMTTGSSRIWSENSDNSSQHQEICSSGPNQQEPNSTIQLSPQARRLEQTTSPQGSCYSRRDSVHSAASKGYRHHQNAHRVFPLERERPFSMIRNDVTLPKLDGVVREKLLTLIESANPSLSDSNVALKDEPLLFTSSLQSYLDLYFTRFNTAYPLVHLPTFQTTSTEPLLLLSLLLLGATYSSKEAHQLAVCIHDVIRPCIFSHAGFSHQPELWTLQTILLVECFGKSRAGQKQHDMSHLFHGLLINLIRRSDCQSVKPVGPPSDPGGNPTKSLQSAWNEWAVAEQKKRLALLCFMWDTQHAVIFCQSLCMSAFELRIDMPCSQYIWEAADAASWQSTWQTTASTSHNVPFLMALKSYLTDSVPRPVGLSLLARVLILHGIMATFWDMQRRDQTSLGVFGSGGQKSEMSWRELIGEAYDAWASDFNAYCGVFINSSRHSSGDSDSAIREEFASFSAAYKALYHSVQIILNADLLDIQIYAGARHILGRPVRQKDYLRSAEIVKRWAASDSISNGASQALATNAQSLVNTSSDGQSACIAARHAAHLLHESKNTLVGADALTPFHVPWCLYIATLSCWAYHHARPSQAHLGHQDPDDQDEIVWDPEGEMNALVSDMTKNSGESFTRKRRTNGLVWTMAEALTKVRWGIVHAGVVVLKGLVPGRLIHQSQ